MKLHKTVKSIPREPDEARTEAISCLSALSHEQVGRVLALMRSMLPDDSDVNEEEKSV